MGNPYASIASFGQAALSAISNIGQLIIQLGEDAIEGVVTIIQDAFQGVLDIIGAIFSAFSGGLDGGGAQIGDAQGVMVATAAVIATTTATVQKLQNQDAADSNNGVNVWVDFSAMADGVGIAGFSQAGIPSGSATLGTAGGFAVLQPITGAANVSAFGIHQTPTNTDYQLVSAIYKSSPSNGRDVLIVRANASMTTYVYATINNAAIALHNVVSGVDTQVAIITGGFPFYAGAAYSLEAGVEGSAATYTVMMNGSAILSWVDTANVTNIGDLYRFCGFGLQKVGGTPSTVAAFGFNDNAPGALIGDMFRSYSTAATPISLLSSNAPAVAPAGYFDTTELASSNYTYDPSTNSLQVATAGIYVVEVSTQWAPNAADTFTYFGTAVFKNGALYRQGNALGTQDPGAEPLFSVASDTFLVQLNAGDFIQPGFFSYSVPTGAGDDSKIAGDPAAELTIFSCALLNTGTAATT